MERTPPSFAACIRCSSIYYAYPNLLQPANYGYLCPKCKRECYPGGVCYVKASESPVLDHVMFRPEYLAPCVPSMEHKYVVQQTLAREFFPSVQALVTSLNTRQLASFVLRADLRHHYQLVACNHPATLSECLKDPDSTVLLHYCYDPEALLRAAESVATSDVFIVLWTSTVKSLELHFDLVFTESVWLRLSLSQRETFRYLQVQIELLLRQLLPDRVFSDSRHAARVELISEDLRIERNGRSFLQRRWFIPSESARAMGFQQLSERGFDFGVTTYEGLFSVQELNLLEHCIDNGLIAAARGSFRGRTADYTTAPGGRLTRTKFFFGAGYGYGKKGGKVDAKDAAAGIFADVEPPPLWLRQLAELPLVSVGLIPSCEWLNSWAVNVYHDGSVGLAQHFDDALRFEQPIFSIRLYSDSRLTFDARGTPMLSPLCYVPMPRGCVTVLECGGYAANRVTHCIRPRDMAGKSAAVILRRMKQPALTAAHAKLG